MAVFFDSSTDALSRTTTLPTITAFTMMGWFYRSTTASYDTLMAFGQNAGSSYYSAFVNATETYVTLYCVASAIGSGTGSFPLNTWLHVAITCAGTGAGQYLGYINGVLAVTASGNGTPTAAKLWFGNNVDNDGCVGLRMAAGKVYSAVLTEAEIAQEMRYYVPVRMANLNTWLPMTEPIANNNAIDFSGIGGNMTVGGTLTVEDGPPIAWAPIAEDVMGMAYTTGGGALTVTPVEVLTLADVRDLRLTIGTFRTETLTLGDTTTTVLPFVAVVLSDALTVADTTPTLVLSAIAVPPIGSLALAGVGV